MAIQAICVPDERYESYRPEVVQGSRFNRGILGLYEGYIGIVEKKMETTIQA